MIPEKIPAIAIDGPASSGKSTIARNVARIMDFLFVDTGSLYRAAALALTAGGVTSADDPRLHETLRSCRIELLPSQSGARVRLEGIDVTDRLRAESIGHLASRISGLPVVRERLYQIQRSLAIAGRIVMDGRDIGTVILPEARLKIFLAADAKVRAIRRMKDLQAQNDTRTLDAILADILERDERDLTRSLAPLVKAPDAYLLDTTHLTIEEAVQWIIERYS